MDKIKWGDVLRCLLLIIFTFMHYVANAAQWLVVTEDAPPLQYVVNGEVQGISTRLVRDVLKQAALQSRFEVFPWARAFDKALRRPNTLIYSTIRTPEREPQFHWIGKIGRFQLSFMALKTNQSFKIDSPAQAKPFIIGVMRDDFTHDYLRGQGFKDSELMIRSSLLELLDLLYKGLIDSFLVDRYLVCDLAEQYKFDCAQLHVAYQVPELSVDVYLAANKDSDANDLVLLKDAFCEVKTRPEYRTGFAGH